MIKKKDSVYEYIQELPIGEKVSVRSLSKQFGVSEGTVYQAIKTAEANGLVRTKPKSGTIRIDNLEKTTRGCILSELVCATGLTVVAGEPESLGIVSKIIVLDGGEDELRRALAEAKAGIPLCIVGDRRDMQLLALQYGASLIVTGRVEIDDAVKIAAQFHKAAVLHTSLDTAAFLSVLYDRTAPPAVFSSSVGDWMDMPKYLFIDDVVESWHQLPGNLPMQLFDYPVVDSESKVCGFVSIRDILSAPLSQKISSLTRRADKFVCFDEGEDMQAACVKMLEADAKYALVTDHDKLIGILSPGNILRYCNCCGTGSSSPSYIPALADISPDRQRLNYPFDIPGGLTRVPEQERLSALFSTMLTAACAHVSAAKNTELRLDSMNFYLLVPIDSATELTISSVLMPSGQNSSVLDIELFDNDTCHAKCSMLFHTGESK